jgi:adenylate cyclase
VSIRFLLHRLAWRGVLVGLCCGLAAWLIAQLEVVRTLEDWMQDGVFCYRGARYSSTKLVIVALDEESLERLQKPALLASPELGEVIRYLHKKRAAAIGLDLIVPQSIEKVPNLDLQAELVGAAAAEAGNVVLAEAFLPHENRWLRPLSNWHLNEPTQDTDFGFVNWSEDNDHFIRRQKLVLGAGQNTDLNFSLALAAVARKAKIETTGDLRLDGEPIPLERERLLINFLGPPGTVHEVPFCQVLDASRGGPQIDFEGAVVIIGVTARSQQDIHATPYANKSILQSSSSVPLLMSGPELHGSIVTTILDRAYIRRLGWLTSLPALLLAGAILGMMFVKLNLSWGLIVAVVHHLAWKILVVAGFYLGNWRIEMFAMLMLGFLVYTLTFIFRWHWLRGMLGVVKSETIARILEADPTYLDLKGEEREMTILFADIRSFTDFSETHRPTEVVSLLNAYFGAVVPLIEAERGTLNTYMGDGILVLYGAPERETEHARQAVATAVAIVRKVHDMKATWVRLGSPAFRIGIGIHTGKVVLGTIGSPRRMEYTVIGDTVNVAARIEAENKKLNTEILISAQTYAALSEKDRSDFNCEESPMAVHVKGVQRELYVHPVSIAAGASLISE